jgi:hypothetical protein
MPSVHTWNDVLTFILKTDKNKNKCKEIYGLSYMNDKNIFVFISWKHTHIVTCTNKERIVDVVLCWQHSVDYQCLFIQFIAWITVTLAFYI